MSNAKAISPGEIAKGMMLTVLEWEPIVHEPDGYFTTTTRTIRDNSYKGDVLEVQAVDLPFIVVKNHTGYSGERPITLDTRRVTLMELSRDFIEAAKRKSAP